MTGSGIFAAGSNGEDGSAAAMPAQSPGDEHVDRRLICVLHCSFEPPRFAIHLVHREHLLCVLEILVF
jgi:hypothetical protein